MATQYAKMALRRRVWAVASTLPLVYLVHDQVVGLHVVRDNTMAPLLCTAPCQPATTAAAAVDDTGAAPPDAQRARGSMRTSDVVLVRKGVFRNLLPAEPGDVVLFK